VNDQEAYAVALRAAPELPEAQRQYSLSVSRGEGGFGAGWGVKSRDQRVLDFAAAHGLTGLEGVGSNNWGAEQGSGDAGSFPHVDFHANGSMYIGQYKRWSSPEKGFLSVARTILNGGKRGTVGAAEIQDAIRRGSLRDAVFAQHANGYFELAPSEYLKAVVRNYGKLADANGWERLLSEAGHAPGLGAIALGLGAATAASAAFYWWWHKRKGVTW
jgi:hypothetical protein